MSLPQFPNPEDILDREEALSAVITSIAMEEQALSHIIEAESAKICYAIKRAKSNRPNDMENLLKINDSAANLLERINDMQLVLKNKLRVAVNALPKQPEPPPKPPVPPRPPCPPPPPKPPCPPNPPCPPLPPLPSCAKCTAEFSTEKRLWSPGETLALEQTHCCGNGVKLDCQHESHIVLPTRKAYRAEIVLSLFNHSGCSAEIELMQEKCGLLIAKQYKLDGQKQEIKIDDVLILEGAEEPRSLLSLRLLSQGNLDVRRGKIRITD